MNVDWVYHLPAPLRSAAYFALQRAIGSRIQSTWRAFLQWEKLDSFQLEARVDRELKTLLRHAVEGSPYYRALALEFSGAKGAVNILRRFPVLTRETVRDRFRELVIDVYQKEIVTPASISFRRYDWLTVKTGGTTGTPTTVVHDALFRDWGRASRLYSQRLCGFPLGTRYFRLWGSEQDLTAQAENLDRRLLRNLLGEIPLNAFRVRERELYKHWQTMNRNSAVQHLMAYVDAAAGLAHYIQDQKLAPPRLRTIMACAGTVTPDYRKTLETTFGSQVFDKYGSRDCADLACECEAHSGLHVFSPNVFLEIVDDENQPVPPGETGRILVTLLHNRIFPMIRYEIGDLGRWASPSPCPCGSPFPRLESLQGRADDMLTTEDGASLSSAFVRHILGVTLNRQIIREWQLEQTHPRQFLFRYVPARREGLESNLRAIEQAFQKILSTAVQIQFCEVNEIPPSSSGKQRFVINRCR